MKDNAEFVYAYRDASNYKWWGGVVFRGSHMLSIEEARTRLQAALGRERTFIADQVRVPEVFPYLESGPTADDHCLHEFFSISVTQQPENDIHKRSLAEFVAEMEDAATEGWLGFVESSPGRRRVRFRFAI